MPYSTGCTGLNQILIPDLPPAAFVAAAAACYEVGVKAERPLFETADPEAEAEADARADADVRSGDLISHKAVRRWLGTWGRAKLMPHGPATAIISQM
jgi:hypothetical protein